MEHRVIRFRDDDGKGGRYESFANELLSEISGASGRFMPRT